MALFTALTLALAAVSAFDLPPQRDIAPFQITDFSAANEPSLAGDNAWLTVVKANLTIKPDEGQLYCEISNATVNATVIAPVVNATCDEDPSVSMMLLPDVNGQGITFAVYWRESSHITLYGSHAIGGDQWGQIAIDGEPQMTSYNGTTDFAMPVDTEITNG